MQISILKAVSNARGEKNLSALKTLNIPYSALGNPFAYNSHCSANKIDHLTSQKKRLVHSASNSHIQIAYTKLS